MLEEDLADRLDDNTRGHLTRIRASTARMTRLIDDMLELSRASRGAMKDEPIDLSVLARRIAEDLSLQAKGRSVTFVIPDGLAARGDPSLVRAVLENVLGNAFKFTSKVIDARIEVGGDAAEEPGQRSFFVRDNGAGFDMKYASKLFAPFQRLHTDAEFPGTGVGLATVQRIVHRHGGRVRAESQQGRGATFWFTLPVPAAS
jgi:signal transduction histidine kinase